MWYGILLCFEHTPMDLHAPSMSHGNELSLSMPCFLSCLDQLLKELRRVEGINVGVIEQHGVHHPPTFRRASTLLRSMSHRRLTASSAAGRALARPAFSISLPRLQRLRLCHALPRFLTLLSIALTHGHGLLRTLGSFGVRHQGGFYVHAVEQECRSSTEAVLRRRREDSSNTIMSPMFRRMRYLRMNQRPWQESKTDELECAPEVAVHLHVRCLLPCKSGRVTLSIRVT